MFMLDRDRWAKQTGRLWQLLLLETKDGGMYNPATYRTYANLCRELET